LKRRLVQLAVLLLLGAIVWLLWRETHSDPLLRLRAWSSTVDRWHTPPGGRSRVRVLITDQGALGYGAIYVYKWSVFRGYDLLLAEGPAVAVPDSHRLRWISEREVDVIYANPHSAGEVQRRIAIE
jgi:hypothetical protein